jgi:hypothetical protein
MPEVDLRTFPSLLVFATTSVALASPASAQSFTIDGVAGYLSEWRLSGNVTQASAGISEFAGALTVKHIGLCTHDGPDEKTTEITIRTTASRSTSRIQATFNLDGASCSLSGTFSGTYTGSMDCADAKGVPVSFSMTSTGALPRGRTSPTRTAAADAPPVTSTVNSH